MNTFFEIVQRAFGILLRYIIYLTPTAVMAAIFVAAIHYFTGQYPFEHKTTFWDSWNQSFVFFMGVYGCMKVMDRATEDHDNYNP